jgi:hypothetical protein
MQDLRWPTLEQALEQYLKEKFTDDTIKRESQFETLWQAAYQEGGKFHLRGFMEWVESEAKNIE